MPNQDERRSRRIEWSIVSKAADKPRSVRQVMTHDFDDKIMNGEKNSFSGMMFDIGKHY